MRNTHRKLLTAFILSLSSIAICTGIAAADYNPSMLMSDSIFRDSSSMSSADIQNFLTSKGSGLASYKDVENCGSSSGSHYAYYATYYSCGQSVLASKIIYDSAQAYGISPRVILATLQKEQSLVTAPNPTSSQLNCAMGYYSCNGYVGFFQQVDNGTWQFRTYMELMNGNSWWGYGSSSYPCSDAATPNVYYSTGLYPGRTVTFYNPGGVAKTVTLGSSATAALYCYTPHVGPFSETGYSGSYNFVYYFELWFGSVTGACYNGSNAPGIDSGANVIANKFDAGQPDRLSFTLLNNTGSKCAEVHTWNSGYQSYQTDIATNLFPMNPADGTIISGNTYNDGRDELMLVRYNSTGSGKIEVHTWKPGYQTWLTSIATNLPSSDAASGRVLAADVNGDGRDELLFVKTANTGSGKIEVHVWNPGYQTWMMNVATNLPSSEAGNGTFITGNVNGQDRLIYVKTANTGSGKIEVHVWNPGYQTWMMNVATNLSNGDSSNGKIVAIDDKLAFVKLHSSASGKIEVHTWKPGYQSFLTDIATSQSSF